MLLNQIMEKYDKKHVCLTPDAIYSTKIHTHSISVKVKLPKDIVIPEKDVEDLEPALHYAIEKILAKYF